MEVGVVVEVDAAIVVEFFRMTMARGLWHQ
jgi:hypothetical protein